MWRVLPATLDSGTSFITVLPSVILQRDRAAALAGGLDREGAGVEGFLADRPC